MSLMEPVKTLLRSANDGPLHAIVAILLLIIGGLIWEFYGRVMAVVTDYPSHIARTDEIFVQSAKNFEDISESFHESSEAVKSLERDMVAVQIRAEMREERREMRDQRREIRDQMTEGE